MEDETKALQVRFPIPMYNLLLEESKKSRRSLNAEIITCLEKYFQMIAESEDKDNLIEVLSFVDAEAVAKAIEKLKGSKRKAPK